MNKQPNYIKQHLEQKQKQDNTDILAVALCSLMGANVVRKADFDKVNQEKQELLRKTKDIEEISMRL